MKKNELVIFETVDNAVQLEVPIEGETVWLNRQQMAELFDRDVKTIGKHINNALREELDDQVVVAKFATTTPHGAIEGKTQTHMTDFYNLDVIISVGYRVKSKRGVEFRKWAASCAGKINLTLYCQLYGSTVFIFLHYYRQLYSTKNKKLHILTGSLFVYAFL